MILYKYDYCDVLIIRCSRKGAHFKMPGLFTYIGLYKGLIGGKGGITTLLSTVVQLSVHFMWPGTVEKKKFNVSHAINNHNMGHSGTHLYLCVRWY